MVVMSAYLCGGCVSVWRRKVGVRATLYMHMQAILPESPTRQDGDGGMQRAGG